WKCAFEMRTQTTLVRPELRVKLLFPKYLPNIPRAGSGRLLVIESSVVHRISQDALNVALGFAVWNALDPLIHIQRAPLRDPLARPAWSRIVGGRRVFDLAELADELRQVIHTKLYVQAGVVQVIRSYAAGAVSFCNQLPGSRHELHQAASPDPGDRIRFEYALLPDQAGGDIRIYPVTLRFLSYHFPVRERKENLPRFARQL